MAITLTLVLDVAAKMAAAGGLFSAIPVTLNYLRSKSIDNQNKLIHQDKLFLDKQLLVDKELVDLRRINANLIDRLFAFAKETIHVLDTWLAATTDVEKADARAAAETLVIKLQKAKFFVWD